MDQESRKKPGAGHSKESSEEGEGEQMRIKINDRRKGGHDVSDEAEAVELARPDEASDAADGSDASENDELKAKLLETETKFKDAERQVSDLADRFRKAQLQLKSETDEIRTRLQRSFDQKVEASRGELVTGLLDTLDNLKRAVAAAESSEGGQVDFKSLLEGVKSTVTMFDARMKSLGLTEIATVGEHFNPEVHEAVEIVESDTENDNHVVSELQPGYKLGERLLRPARVRVGRATRGSGRSE